MAQVCREHRTLVTSLTVATEVTTKQSANTVVCNCLCTVCDLLLRWSHCFINLTFMNPCIMIHQENNQQHALYRLIYYSKSAVHVSGYVFAHHQKHLTVFTVSGSVHPSCCWLVSWMIWNCVPTHP